MIQGEVRNREAIIELVVLGPSGGSQLLKVVIDTGYNGYLTLPRSVITALAHPFAGHRRATLADGSTTILEVYLAAVVWHDARKEILISHAGGMPLLGMALLEGNRLTMDARDGGSVRIEKLPTPA